jgi:hypothetical protein
MKVAMGSKTNTWVARSPLWRRYLVVALWAYVVVLLESGCGESPASRYKEVAAFRAPEAYQAAAADDDSIYAIEATTIARYDRRSFKLIARSTGRAHHLNSGFVWDGALYCANTTQDGHSEIVILDPATMVVRKFKDLSDHPGKITWVVRDVQFWWANFAFYGLENTATYLAKFDAEWRELGRWHYPSRVVSDLGGESISGGVIVGPDVLVTGHDKKVIYRVRLPASGQLLQFVEAIPSPFPGQGIAIDPISGDLIGIDRNSRMVKFARMVFMK